MYLLTHPEHGETIVHTELAYMRHTASGWALKEPQEKAAERATEEPKKRTRKAKAE